MKKSMEHVLKEQVIGIIEEEESVSEKKIANLRKIKKLFIENDDHEGKEQSQLKIDKETCVLWALVRVRSQMYELEPVEIKK